MILDRDSRAEIEWWLSNFDTWNGSRLWDYRPRITVVGMVDASGFAWGAHTTRTFAGIGLLEARGSLTVQEARNDSTYREMVGFLRFLETVAPKLHGKANAFQMGSDSASGVRLVNSQNGHMRHDYQALLLQIFLFCLEQDIRLHMDWFPREQNTHADRLSKAKDDDDLMLDPDEFWAVHTDPLWGPYDWDRTASSVNHQAVREQRFSAQWDCPGCTTVDCFLDDWAGWNNWSNPPFILIPRILQHMRACHAFGTILVPAWPNRPWWCLLFPGAGTSAPWVVRIKHLPARRGLFRKAFGGSSVPAPSPTWDCFLVKLDFRP
jgi:hypothetical protein